MAIFNQVGRLPIQGGDWSMKNYSGTAIASGTGVIFDGGASNLMGVLPPTTSGAITQTCGITLENIAAGKMGLVCVSGGAVATANATLAAGDAVMLDNTSGNEGKVILKTTGSRQLGVAAHACVAGDPVLVLVGLATSL